MRETLLALSYPLVLCASGVYAGCSCWWRRRQRRRGVLPADVHPAFFGQHRARPVEEQVVPSVVVTAELIVSAEWARTIAER